MASKMDRIETCVRCGMLYESFYGRTTCPSCSLEEDQSFIKVRRYIHSHKDVGIYEVSEACDVSPTLIIDWVKEERLVFAEEAGVFLECEQCGLKIRSGKYCKTCKTKLVKTLSSAYDEIKENADKEAREKPKRVLNTDDRTGVRFNKTGLRFNNKKH